MVNESTRRGILASTVALLGVGAGCQVFADDNDMRRTDATPDEASLEETDEVAGPDGTDRSTQAEPAGQIYVERSVSDLPSNPDRSSFAVTGQGILRYDRSDGGGWRPIQYGTEAAPVESVAARSATVGTAPSGRPLISNGDRTVYVDPDDGDDGAAGTEDAPLATIQEAVRRAPIYLRDQYVVDLATVPETPVTYDEDVLVPTIVGTGQAAKEQSASEAGPFLNLVIEGVQNDPDAVTVGSVLFGNVVGTSAGNLFYVTVDRNTPYDDEESALTAYGTGEVHVYNVKFTDGPRNGILSYGAKMKASRIHFGDRNVNLGIRGKRHASIIADRASGATQSTGYIATSNSKIAVKEGSKVNGDPTFETRLGGVIHDQNDDSWYGVGPAPGTSGYVDAASKPDVRVASTHPSDADPGEVYYVDGSGDVDEGFYGQTGDGPVRFG